MKFWDTQAAMGVAVLLLSLPCEAKHGHQLSHLRHYEKRHQHNHAHASPRAEEGGLQKRGQCVFPTDAGLVAVTPNEQNAGWAMSPDQPCKPGNYCPYACPSGQVMSQWNPSATSYVYPLSLEGGLYCGLDGKMSKPFPDKPYCVDGTGTVGAQSTCGEEVAFCQTVLPGDESMLIPTSVNDWVQLAVPDITYYAEVAAHYYVNPPGVGVVDACVWGDGSKPIGNWSPYVAGANTDSNGNTFAKIGWNPIFTGCSLSGTPPTFGIEIICSDGADCNGLPCRIDPASNSVNSVTSPDSASGAGGADFCVVTIPKGSTANVVVFSAGNSNSGSGSAGSSQSSTPTSKPSPTSTPTPTPTPTPTTSSISTSSSSSSSSSLLSSSSSSSLSSSSSSSSVPPSTSLTVGATSILYGSTTSINTTHPYPTAANSPHILFENETTAGPTAAIGSGSGSAILASGTGVGASPIATESGTKSSASTTVFSGSMLFGFIAIASYFL
ncbi:hypothetical protein B7494_g617 [Chlorociboria aeruginascens]|nr:hypothetical protein B7494_g617 [Chlorociboria aeruginascens]